MEGYFTQSGYVLILNNKQTMLFADETDARDYYESISENNQND